MYLIRSLCLLGCLALLTGCNTLRKSDDVSAQVSADPLQGFNRSVYSFNTALDKAVLRPVAKGYDKILPAPAKTSVGHFFSNLGEPINIVNNLLQGKYERALGSTYRFTVNSTVGILGLFDVAKAHNVDRSPEDLGQTLAAWGVKPGPYIMLPFFGPSNLRDGVGTVATSLAYLSSDLVTDSSATATGLTILDAVSTRARLLGADQVLDQQLDPYAFLKVAYERNRLTQLYDGNPPELPEEELDF